MRPEIVLNDGDDEATGSDFGAGLGGRGEGGGAAIGHEIGDREIFVDVSLADVFVGAVVGDEGDAVVIELRNDGGSVEGSAGEELVARLGAVFASEAGVGERGLELGIIFAREVQGLLQGKANDVGWIGRLRGGRNFRRRDGGRFLRVHE